MIHPDTEVRAMPQRGGKGVFATAPLPCGTLVVVRDACDSMLTRAQFASLPSVLRDTLETYLYHDATGHLLLSWDHAKYMNHCCHPNTMLTAYGFEIVVRDIAVNEELTTEYGLLNVQEGYPIVCERSDCRQRLSLQDVPGLCDTWDARILHALARIGQVEQVLWPLVDPETRTALAELPQTYRSVRQLLWQA